MADENHSARVFISYSRTDAPLARELSTALANAGLRPWLDADEIRAGERWKERVAQMLRDARVMVILLTPSSAHSPRTFFEVGAAVADHKIIIPVLSDDMNPGDIPALLREFQWIKASVPAEAGEAVARAVRSAAASAAG